MFTGIVEDLGEIEAIEYEGGSARIHIRSATVTRDARIGDSIAVNGVCLTVTGLTGNQDGNQVGNQDESGNQDRNQDGNGPAGFVADVMGETLRLTSLKAIAPGTKVNLERAVRASGRLGGHLVQGHVDGTGTILSRDPVGRGSGLTTVPDPRPTGSARGDDPPEPPGEHWDVVRISLPEDTSRYVAHKGSITVDGVSLTVSGIGEDWFEVSLIPETLKHTTLGIRQPGETVNLEVDVIAKYVEKLLGGAP